MVYERFKFAAGFPFPMSLDTIPWIGFIPQLGWAADLVEVKLGKKVECISGAAEGLQKVLAEQFPLILINEDVAAGELQLPQDLWVGDSVGIACHVIGQIRRSSPYTSILVSQLNHPPSQYLKAGATACINWKEYGVRPPSFSDFVRKYLPPVQV